jgi:hypothetical protein
MTTPGSLIQAAVQADRAAPTFSFFSEEEKEASEKLAGAGEFTGERLHRDRPGVYAAAVRMAAEGLSISATSRALGISRNTVCAVRDREGFSIEQDKKELLRDLRRASRLGVEKVLELLPETKLAKDAAIVAAVMVDKMQLLSGEATARVERLEVKPDQVKAFLDSLPVVDAEVIEVVPMGVPGETPGQKAAGLVGAVPALPAAGSDLISDASRGLDSVDGAGRATARATAAAGPGAAVLESGPAGDGGGGGAPCDTPAPGMIDHDKQNFGQRAHSAEGEAASNAGEQLGGAGGRCHDAAAEGGGAVGGPLAATILCQDTPKKKGGGPT